MNYKQFPQLPKELIKSEIGISMFEYLVLESPEEMCSHYIEDVVFVLSSSEEIKTDYIFFIADLSYKDQ